MDTDSKVPGFYSDTGIPVEVTAPGLDSEVSKKDTPAVATPGPGLYSEIGKKARDLLYKDFQTDQKFTLTTYTKNGVEITAASTRKDEAILSEIQTQLTNNNVTLDVKATSGSQVLTTITTKGLPIPGLKKIVSFPFPYQTPGKAELQYLHDYAGISFGVGLNPKPLVNLSAVFGNKSVAVGADVAFDSSTENFTEYNAGLTLANSDLHAALMTLANSDLHAALMLNNKGDSLTASYYHLVNEESGSAVGGELTHSFSGKENTVTIGTQHALDPLTTVKVRYNNYGMVGALIQHEWGLSSFRRKMHVGYDSKNKFFYCTGH